MSCFDHAICYFNQDDEGADIRYNMNYMKILE